MAGVPTGAIVAPAMAALNGVGAEIGDAGHDGRRDGGDLAPPAGASERAQRINGPI